MSKDAASLPSKSPVASASSSAHQDLSNLPDDPETLKRMIHELLLQLRSRDRELSGVQHRLDQLLRRLYGPKSEKFHPNQPSLFDILKDISDSTPTPVVTPAPVAPASPAVIQPKPQGHGRRVLPPDLRRERVEHDLAEAEKTCSCCQNLRVKIGEETSEQLDYRPAKLFVWEHVRFKYVCPRCTKAAETTRLPIASPIIVASKPAQPIDKGLPGPGLLAHIIVSKYLDHLPLHRQIAIIARYSVKIPSSTLSDWMAASADVLRPLYHAMLTDILLSRVMQTDETRLPVLEKGNNKTKSGRLWAFLGDRDHPHSVYHYTPTKARDGPAEILKDYKGFLQADAANVFDGFYRPGTIVEVGCWAHARRYFHDAQTCDAVRSAEALARISVFYDVEREATAATEKLNLDGKQSDDLRLQMRREQTLPRLKEFAIWLEAQAKLVLPKSPIAQAINYSRNHWQALLRFTTEGFLNIDNNAAERAMRPAALGRKNFLFAGNDEAGCTTAILYTMTQTCKRHSIDPFVYLQSVLARIPQGDYLSLSDLFPVNWAKQQPVQA